MSFTQVPLSGTVELSSGAPAAGAIILIQLSHSITDGITLVEPIVASVTCNSSGQFSVTVNANDDSTTVPSGTYYTFTVTYNGVSYTSFNSVVPKADSAGAELFSLAQIGTVTPTYPFVETFNGRNGIVTLQSGDILPGTNVTITWSSGIPTINASGSGGGNVSSVFTRTGAVVATTGDYSVSQVTGAAPIASPTFTGTPSGPTAAGGTNTTQFATCAFVTSAISNIAGLASPAFTGIPTAPTAAANTNTTQIATTAFVETAVAQVVNGQQVSGIMLYSASSPPSLITGQQVGDMAIVQNGTTTLELWGPNANGAANSGWGSARIAHWTVVAS